MSSVPLPPSLPYHFGCHSSFLDMILGGWQPGNARAEKMATFVFTHAALLGYIREIFRETVHV